MLRVEASGAADPEDPPHRAPRGALLTPPEPSTAPARKSGGVSLRIASLVHRTSRIQHSDRGVSSPRIRPPKRPARGRCPDIGLHAPRPAPRVRVRTPFRRIAPPAARGTASATSAAPAPFGPDERKRRKPVALCKPRRALGDRLPGPVPLRRSEGSARPGRLAAVTGAWPSVPERRPGEKSPRAAGRRRTRPPRYGVSRETGPRASSAWRSWRRPRGPVKGPRPRRNPVSTVPDAFACRGEACASPSAFAIRKASIRQDFCE